MKKAQAAGAAVLLAIIAGLIISFIIIIPPQDRAELLGEETTDLIGSGGTSTNSKSLINEPLGLLLVNNDRSISHDMQNINLEIEEENKILIEKSDLGTSRNLFSSESEYIRFGGGSDYSDLILNINANSIQGSVDVYLNGDYIDSIKKSSNLELPSEILSEENIIELTSSSVGLAFWRSHYSSLSSLKVVGKETDLSNTLSRQSFVITSQEKDNLESASFKSFIECSRDTSISLNLNSQEIFSGPVDCNSPIFDMEIDPSLLNEGTNQFSINLLDGRIKISKLAVETYLRSIEYPTKYFDLSLEENDLIETGNKRIRLTLNFNPNLGMNTGEIYVNGRKKYFGTELDSLQLDITRDVKLGTNSITFKPLKTIDVLSVNVELI